LAKKFSELKVTAIGMASGVIYGLCLFTCALWAMAIGYSGQFGILSVIYPGYSATLLGSIGGLLYGLIDGFLMGAIFAWIYNKMI